MNANNSISARGRGSPGDPLPSPLSSDEKALAERLVALPQQPQPPDLDFLQTFQKHTSCSKICIFLLFHENVATFTVQTQFYCARTLAHYLKYNYAFCTDSDVAVLGRKILNALVYGVAYFPQPVKTQLAICVARAAVRSVGAGVWDSFFGGSEDLRAALTLTPQSAPASGVGPADPDHPTSSSPKMSLLILVQEAGDSLFPVKQHVRNNFLFLWNNFLARVVDDVGAINAVLPVRDLAEFLKAHRRGLELLHPTHPDTASHYVVVRLALQVNLPNVEKGDAEAYRTVTEIVQEILLFEFELLDLDTATSGVVVEGGSPPGADRPAPSASSAGPLGAGQQHLRQQLTQYFHRVLGSLIRNYRCNVDAAVNLVHFCFSSSWFLTHIMELVEPLLELVKQLLGLFRTGPPTNGYHGGEQQHELGGGETGAPLESAHVGSLLQSLKLLFQHFPAHSENIQSLILEQVLETCRYPSSFPIRTISSSLLGQLNRKGLVSLRRKAEGLLQQSVGTVLSGGGGASSSSPSGSGPAVVVDEVRVLLDLDLALWILAEVSSDFEEGGSEESPKRILARSASVSHDERSISEGLLRGIGGGAGTPAHQHGRGVVVGGSGSRGPAPIFPEGGLRTPGSVANSVGGDFNIPDSLGGSLPGSLNPSIAASAGLMDSSGRSPFSKKATVGTNHTDGAADLEIDRISASAPSDVSDARQPVSSDDASDRGHYSSLHFHPQLHAAVKLLSERCGAIIARRAGGFDAAAALRGPADVPVEEHADVLSMWLRISYLQYLEHCFVDETLANSMNDIGEFIVECLGLVIAPRTSSFPGTSRNTARSRISRNTSSAPVRSRYGSAISHLSGEDEEFVVERELLHAVAEVLCVLVEAEEQDCQVSERQNELARSRLGLLFGDTARVRATVTADRGAVEHAAGAGAAPGGGAAGAPPARGEELPHTMQLGRHKQDDIAGHCARCAKELTRRVVREAQLPIHFRVRMVKVLDTESNLALLRECHEGIRATNGASSQVSLEVVRLAIAVLGQLADYTLLLHPGWGGTTTFSSAGNTNTAGVIGVEQQLQVNANYELLLYGLQHDTPEAGKTILSLFCPLKRNFPPDARPLLTAVLARMTSTSHGVEAISDLLRQFRGGALINMQQQFDACVNKLPLHTHEPDLFAACVSLLATRAKLGNDTLDPNDRVVREFLTPLLLWDTTPEHGQLLRRGLSSSVAAAASSSVIQRPPPPPSTTATSSPIVPTSRVLREIFRLYRFVRIVSAADFYPVYACLTGQPLVVDPGVMEAICECVRGDAWTLTMESLSIVESAELRNLLLNRHSFLDDQLPVILEDTLNLLGWGGTASSRGEE